MAYTTPATFADGNILTAAQLNILSDDIEFLYSLMSGINIPFSSQTLTGSGNTRKWIFRHQARYLHYKFRLTTGTSDELDIRLGAADTIEYTDATNRTAAYTWTGYIDLTATTENPADGDFYHVFVEFDFAAAGEFIVDYFLESDSTTL